MARVRRWPNNVESGMGSGSVACEGAEGVRSDSAKEGVPVVGELRMILELDVAILSVGKVVMAEVGSAKAGKVSREGALSPADQHSPAHQNAVIKAIALHVLQSPSLIESARYQTLLPPSKVGRVVKANVHLIREGSGEGGDEGRGSRFRNLASRAQVVHHKDELERRVSLQRRVERLDLFVAGSSVTVMKML